MNKNKIRGISFEVFPPKKASGYASVINAAKELKEFSPDFISVTYGAGGSQSKKTVEIASYIENELGIPAIAHLTCVGNTKKEISDICEELKNNNIERVLALRGDRPDDMTDTQYNLREFTYASDLIKFIKEKFDFKIYAACYPEKHFEAESLEKDIMYMKLKQDLGAGGFITQLFFENSFFYNFREKAAKIGITSPVYVGIMPVTSSKQIGTSVSLSGSTIPKALADMIAKYGDKPEEMYKAGIEYAVNQIRDLTENGVDGIHLYTMNKPETARRIVSEL